MAHGQLPDRPREPALPRAVTPGNPAPSDSLACLLVALRGAPGAPDASTPLQASTASDVLFRCAAHCTRFVAPRESTGRPVTPRPITLRDPTEYQVLTAVLSPEACSLRHKTTCQQININTTPNDFVLAGVRTLSNRDTNHRGRSVSDRSAATLNCANYGCSLCCQNQTLVQTGRLQVVVESVFRRVLRRPCLRHCLAFSTTTIAWPYSASNNVPWTTNTIPVIFRELQRTMYLHKLVKNINCLTSIRTETGRKLTCGNIELVMSACYQSNHPRGLAQEYLRS